MSCRGARSCGPVTSFIGMVKIIACREGKDTCDQKRMFSLRLAV